MPSLTDFSSVSETLPPVLAGPLLRRVEPGRLVFWLVASRPLVLALVLQSGAHAQQRVIQLDGTGCQRLPIGRYAVLHLVDVTLDEALPVDCLIEYDLRISGEGLDRKSTRLNSSHVKISYA